MFCFINFISSIFDPSSKTYGAVTIVASFGTIIALLVTIQSVKESRDQFKLLTKRNALDNLNKTLDDILERIVYMKDAASVEVYFGRPAVYRAIHGEPTRVFEGERNVGHFKEYVRQLAHVVTESQQILKEIKHSETCSEYNNKLKLEIKFSTDYIKPLLEVMRDRFEVTRKEAAEALLAKLAEINQQIQNIDLD